MKEMISTVCDMLKALPEFSTVAVFDENLGDVSAQIHNAIAKSQALALMVRWDGLTPKAQSEGSITGDTVLVVRVFEHPAKNRRVPGFLTALEAARTAALSLVGKPLDASRLFFVRITPLVELEGGVISCDVEFRVTVTL